MTLFFLVKAFRQVLVSDCMIRGGRIHKFKECKMAASRMKSRKEQDFGAYSKNKVCACSKNKNS